jgi:hypothetical protein
MDKKFLKAMFEKDRKRIDSIIRQMEDWGTISQGSVVDIQLLKSKNHCCVYWI